MMTQKLLKVGSSAAVTIPKKSLKELGLKIGDEVYVSIDEANRKVIVSKKKPNLAGISEKDIQVMRWTKKFIEQYGKDLRALAEK